MQRNFKRMLVVKHLKQDLVQNLKVPLNVNSILALINLKAADDSDASLKLKKTILLKGLPKIFKQINALLRF